MYNSNFNNDAMECYFPIYKSLPNVMASMEVSKAWIDAVHFSFPAFAYDFYQLNHVTKVRWLYFRFSVSS